MSTAIALDAAWIFAAFLVIIVLAAVGLATRRILLDRRGGTVECGLRRPAGTWRLAAAPYEAGGPRSGTPGRLARSPAGEVERRARAVPSPRARWPAETALPGA